MSVNFTFLRERTRQWARVRARPGARLRRKLTENPRSHWGFHRVRLEIAQRYYCTAVFPRSEHHDIRPICTWHALLIHSVSKFLAVAHSVVSIIKTTATITTFPFLFHT